MNHPTAKTVTFGKDIRYLRNYYQATNNIPTVYEVCQAHNLDLCPLGAALNELHPSA